MNLDISHIGQIGLGVADVDRAERFYAEVVGLKKLFRFGDLSFFDCAGVRLLLERPGQPRELVPVYVLLASDEASYVSGATAAVTGGKPII